MPESIEIGGKRYEALLSLQRRRNGDYFIKLVFQDLKADQANELKYMYKFPQTIPLTSQLLNTSYGVYSVVVTKHEKASPSEIIWKCKCYQSQITDN